MSSTSDATAILSAVDQIASEVAAPEAAAVDRQGTFPRKAINALRDAGVLGLLSATEVGGQGKDLATAAAVVQRLARECGSTAMVTCMHYCAAAVIEKYGTDGVRRDATQKLSTLAFSEAGSRSHFWAPVGTAEITDNGVALNAQKSWVTSARAAATYVWSSGPVVKEGASTLWLVPADAAGLHVPAAFDGLGLRGNDSSPVIAENVIVDERARLGEDGSGFSIMMETVLPTFSVLSAACSVGLMSAAVERTAQHASGTRYQHLSSALAELPTIRAYIARMSVRTDMTRTLVDDTLAAMANGRDDTMLRVLQCKAAAGESATEVLQTAMRVCGGAAYRKDVGVERLFRDAQAATVMAPTTDVLYDFIGKALCGLPLF